MMSRRQELLSRLNSLRLELETLKLLGYDGLEGPLREDWLETLSGDEKRNAPTERAGAGPTGLAGAGKERELAKIRREVEACRLCDLSKTRTNTVFGVGSADARLMFIGEAPGAEEDRRGEPFVGRAGRLLTSMIEAMGLRRDDVYIANILKCRPPGNRDPLPGEVEVCEPYLIRQIEVIGPEVICALGAVSARTLLKTKASISRLRGEFHPYHGTPLLPTFHPAYLLRNPAAKKDAWNDLQMVMRKLGLTPPRRKG